MSLTAFWYSVIITLSFASYINEITFVSVFHYYLETLIYVTETNNRIMPVELILMWELLIPFFYLIARASLSQIETLVSKLLPYFNFSSCYHVIISKIRYINFYTCTKIACTTYEIVITSQAKVFLILNKSTFAALDDFNTLNVLIPLSHYFFQFQTVKD